MQVIHCKKRFVISCFSFVFFSALGCEENPPDNPVSLFDRPKDVAFVCYDVDAEQDKARPLEDCKIDPSDETVGRNRSTRLFAFVTQTTPGEVAVVDYSTLSIIDQDNRIPYKSFVPVGGQPSDIAASSDGQKVYTANRETNDLSVITVWDETDGSSVIEQPRMKPTDSIDVGAPAARLVLADDGDFKDRFAFVTQPTAGRLAVVSLNGDVCPSPGTTPNGCLLGYLQVSDFMSDSSEPQDPAALAEIRPWSIISSGLTPSVYLGSSHGDFILELDGHVLIAEALGLEEPGPLSDGAIARKIDLAGYTTRDMALEPDLERWIYAIDNEEGGVIAINIQDEGDIRTIDLPFGRARAVEMIRLAEDDEPGPLTFNGTFAIISTTTAEIIVIDVDDENAAAAIYQHPHSIRSAVDLSEESEDLPRLTEEPVLMADGTALVLEKVKQYAYLVGSDAEFADGGLTSEDAGSADGGAGEELPQCEAGKGELFRPETSHGIRFRCDPRLSRREIWNLTYEGRVGIRGAVVIRCPIAGAASKAEQAYCADHPLVEGEMILTDEGTDFCEKGLNTGYFLPDDYLGDLLLVTSAPQPDLNDEALVKECRDKYKDSELSFLVTEVLDPNTIKIANSAPTFPSPVLDRRCFDQAFSYEIRAREHWVLTGSQSGNLYDGKFEETDAGPRCVYDTQETLGRTQRVLPGVPFENYYFSFTLEHGDLMSTVGVPVPDAGPEDEDNVQELYFSFATVGGFQPLSYVVGHNITDIAVTPNQEIVLIDQSDNGLIRFDMKGNFETIGMVN